VEFDLYSPILIQGVETRHRETFLLKLWLLSLQQGDSLARGPKLVYLQILNEFVNQLRDDKLTTGYYPQDGATYHT